MIEMTLAAEQAPAQTQRLNQRLLDLAKLLWENSVAIPFGDESQWDEMTLKATWRKRKLPAIDNRNGPGLYWISAPLSVEYLCALERPDLPEGGIDSMLSTLAYSPCEPYGKRVKWRSLSH